MIDMALFKRFDFTTGSDDSYHLVKKHLMINQTTFIQKEIKCLKSIHGGSPRQQRTSKSYKRINRSRGISEKEDVAT
jgi:hypothetical protein